MPRVPRMLSQATRRIAIIKRVLRNAFPTTTNDPSSSPAAAAAMASAAELDTSPLDAAASYREVKAWIARQEAFEAQHKTPAPLTKLQRKALEALRQLVSITVPSSVGEVNYIGLLNEYRQSHPSGGELAWTDINTGLAAGAGWACRLKLAECTAPFPLSAAGDDRGLVSFPTKKAARQYAARCALDWLATQSHDVGSGQPSSLKRPLANASPPPPVALAAPSPPDETTTTATTTDDGPAPSPPLKKKHQIPGAEEPATQRVVEICKELGIRPPRYQLTATAPGGSIFDGHAEFDDGEDDEVRALARVCAVAGVQPKERARQAVAAKVLERLQAVRAEKELQADIIWKEKFEGVLDLTMD